MESVEESAFARPGWAVWLQAARPKTLAAAVVPVGVGSALAAGLGYFQAFPAAVCLVFALLVQVGTNYANDYFDCVKGADTPERVGPVRAVASGKVSGVAMRRATGTVFVCAFCAGLWLIPYGGWILLPIGILCILCGFAYTGGPFPLAYNGLGEVFVLVFFGFVATGGTFFVQAGGFPVIDGVSSALAAVASGTGVGCLACTILVVNNLRDRFTDAPAGKRTLAVRFGRRFSELEYVFLVAAALLGSLGLAVVFGHTAVALPWLLSPLFVKHWIRLRRAQAPDDWARLLTGSAAALLLYGVLTVAGVLWTLVD